MPTFNVDYHLNSHPAVYKAGDAAMGLWLRLGCWLATFPKQGDVLPAVIVKHYGSPAQVRRLVDAELLLPLDDGGYRLNKSMAIATSGLGGASWEIGEGANASRRAIPSHLRASVYDRDGRACLECGATDDLTLDHVYPYSLGGEDTLDNLRTLCRPCNSRKGARV